MSIRDKFIALAKAGGKRRDFFKLAKSEGLTDKETLAKNEDFARYLYVEITEVREKSIILKSTMKEFPEMIIYSELIKLD